MDKPGKKPLKKKPETKKIGSEEDPLDADEETLFGEEEDPDILPEEDPFESPENDDVR